MCIAAVLCCALPCQLWQGSSPRWLILCKHHCHCHNTQLATACFNAVLQHCTVFKLLTCRHCILEHVFTGTTYTTWQIRSWLDVIILANHHASLAAVCRKAYWLQLCLECSSAPLAHVNLAEQEVIDVQMTQSAHGLDGMPGCKHQLLQHTFCGHRVQTSVQLLVMLIMHCHQEGEAIY